MEPAVNNVVEVFIEPSSDYLPRLKRIAEVIADCTGAELADATSHALAQLCVPVDGAPSIRANVRFSVASGQVVADTTAPDASSKVDFCLSRQ